MEALEILVVTPRRTPKRTRLHYDPISIVADDDDDDDENFCFSDQNSNSANEEDEYDHQFDFLHHGVCNGWLLNPLCE